MSDQKEFLPRHIASVEKEECSKMCFIIDGILVPFPTCQDHGDRVDIGSTCGIMGRCL